MDPTPVIDGIVTVIQSNPKTAGFLALIPLTQMAAALVSRVPFVKRTHSTWFNRGLNWWARWPGPKS